MSDERAFQKQSFAGIVEEMLASLRSGVGGRVVLDDASEGSVVRTLVEAFGRELAVCYEQIDAVYKAGYLDTAGGAALDRVVELLGVERHRAGWLEGHVVFSRATPAPYDIEIPEGTLVAGRGVQAFETLAAAVLREGQTSVRVPVRSLVPEGQPVEPAKLSLLKRPIPGIESASNPGLLLPRRESESDDDLRTRARNAIRGGHTATTSAIERAVLALGIVEVSVFEDPDRAGMVNVVLGDEDLTEAELQAAAAAVDEVRPVGVRVNTFAAKPVLIRVRAVVRLEQELDARDSSTLRAELERAITGYFAALRANEKVAWIKIRNLITANPKVAEVLLPTTRPPLEVVDADGAPQPRSVEGMPPRSSSASLDVYVASDERARLVAVELDLQPPVLPVWIDVAIDASTSVETIEKLESELSSLLRDMLPSEPLTDTISVDWGLIAESLDNTDLEASSLRLVILHDRNGRVVTLAKTGDKAALLPREKIELRTVTVNPVTVNPKEGS